MKNIFSYIDWPQGYDGTSLKMDILAGLTVALVLIPQSMAYAEIAGLPPHYGLYASFLPPMIAALLGSSRQLATGPVAVVSLLTATTLEPLAIAGSQQYIAYAVLLALLVGVFQFSLGALKLGLVVNFISHPVVNGFSNAAALIIATSQLPKLFGIHIDKTPHHYELIYRVLKAAVPDRWHRAADAHRVDEQGPVTCQEGADLHGGGRSGNRQRPADDAPERVCSPDEIGLRVGGRATVERHRGGLGRKAGNATFADEVGHRVWLGRVESGNRLRDRSRGAGEGDVITAVRGLVQERGAVGDAHRPAVGPAGDGADPTGSGVVTRILGGRLEARVADRHRQGRRGDQ